MIRRLGKITAYIAIGILVIIVAIVAFYWAPDRSVTELKQWQLPNSEFIDVQGMQVHVAQTSLCEAYHSRTMINDLVRLGTTLPEVMVLLHGTSASLHTWEGWTTPLNDEYCVVSMDLPGFGLTGPFADETTKYTSENYAAFVIQVLDTLHLKNVTLVGNSLGGKIAWRTAALYPDYINNLILVDSVGYPATPKSIPIGFKLAKYPALAPILNHVLPRDVVKKSILSVYADESKVDDALINRYYELTLRQGNRQALSKRLRESDDINDQTQIKRLNLPTLILWGAQDDLIPVENATLFHRDINDSQLKVFDELGHVPQEEDPLATVAIVKLFMAGELLDKEPLAKELLSE